MTNDEKIRFCFVIPSFVIGHPITTWSHSTKLAGFRGPASRCWMPRRYVWSFCRAESPNPEARNSITPRRDTIQSGKYPSRMYVRLLDAPLVRAAEIWDDRTTLVPYNSAGGASAAPRD